MDDQQWYAGYTKYRKEDLFERSANEKGFETYLPRKITGEPLFNNYVFVHVYPQDLHQLTYLKGLTNMVRFNGYPSTIPTPQVELLKKIELHYNDMQSRSSHMVKGDRVLIVKGPLSGHEGLLTQNQGTHKVALSMLKLNQSVLINVPLSHVIPLENNPDLSFNELNFA